MAATGPSKPRLRERAMSVLTFFYGPADHRELPDDARRSTGQVGEDVGDGLRRHGEPGRFYAQRDPRPSATGSGAEPSLPDVPGAQPGTGRTPDPRADG